MKNAIHSSKSIKRLPPAVSIANIFSFKNDIYHSISDVIILFTMILFSAFQLIAQESINEISEVQESLNEKAHNSLQTTGDRIEIKNGNGNAIITFTDEGNDNGSIIFSKMVSTPTEIDNKLYNLGGSLMFNGFTIGGAIELNSLSDARTLGNSIFLGSNAGSNDDGSDNKNYGFGVQSLFSNTSGYSNLALGYNTLYFNSVGNQNIGLGQGALYYNSEGSGNVGVGYHTNHFNQTGSNNTIIGHQSGRGTVTHNKSGNVFIGYQAGYNETTSNKLFIENSNSSSPLIWGDFANNDVKIHGDFHVTGNLTSDNLISASDDDWDTGLEAGAVVLYNIANRVGIGTNGATLEPKLHVKGDEGVLFQGTHNNGTALNLGGGTRFHFYPKKSAIRGGYANTNQWDDSNVGNYSTSFGFNTVASGFYSVALGQSTTANNTSSIALGANTIASGKWSTAIGSGSDAIGDYSTAIGDDTKAGAYASVAIGKNNIGGGDPINWVETDPLFEIGNDGTGTNPSNAITVLKNGKVGIGLISPLADLQVLGDNGVIYQGSINQGLTLDLGIGTRMHWYPKKAAFRAGHSIGTEWNDNLIGNYSAALGENVTASSNNSIALGKDVTASGSSSVGIGESVTASGNNSVAIGYNAYSSGVGAIAIGNSISGFSPTWATGNKSVAIGTNISTDNHANSFILGTGDGFVTKNTADNQMTMLFGGGFRLYSKMGSGPSVPSTGVYMDGGVSGWTNISDRNKKENFEEIDGEKLLSKIQELPITKWNYKNADQNIKYVGPMAQDFYKAFRLGGTDSLGINSISIDGINLAGVRALEDRTKKQEERIKKLEGINAQLKNRLTSIERILNKNNLFTSTTD